MAGRRAGSPVGWSVVPRRREIGDLTAREWLYIVDIADPWVGVSSNVRVDQSGQRRPVWQVDGSRIFGVRDGVGGTHLGDLPVDDQQCGVIDRVGAGSVEQSADPRPDGGPPARRDRHSIPPVVRTLVRRRADFRLRVARR